MFAYSPFSRFIFPCNKSSGLKNNKKLNNFHKKTKNCKPTAKKVHSVDMSCRQKQNKHWQ